MKLTAEPSAAGVSILRETYAHPLRFLLGIAGMVLLIACANLASSDVGPNNFARARHGSAASHGRRVMASDPVSAGGEPAAIARGGSGRRGAGSGIKSRVGRVNEYAGQSHLTRIRAGLAALCIFVE